VEAEVPTVCVGNVDVGGTGKTPHTEMILSLLRSSRKWGDANIAVLSLGYGRKGKSFRIVNVGDSASLTGDEPLQIKEKFPWATVAVDKIREEGCEMLCHPDRLKDASFPPSDVIVLDDAFQYRRLRPTVSIVLVDYSRPLDRDALLPFGTLRDLPERVWKADMVIVTKCPAELSVEERQEWLRSMGVVRYDMSSSTGSDREGNSLRIFFSTMEYLPVTGVFQEADHRFAYSHKAVMFTGIARSEPMQRYLSDTYSIVGRLSFADHHRFRRRDISKIMRSVRENPTAVVITTEKDSRRILDCKKIPSELKERLFCLPIKAVFLTQEEDEAFREALLSALEKGPKVEEN